MTEIEYRREPGAPMERAELKGDPFDVCNKVRARLFPDVQIAERDEKFEALMRARKEQKK